DRERIAEACPGQKECSAEAEPARSPDSAGEVPDSIERLVPTGRGGQGLAACGDAVEEHADGPHELEGVTSITPLVEEGGGENKGQHGRDAGQENSRAHVGDVPGGTELVIVPMDAVAQAPDHGVAGSGQARGP